MLAVTQKQMRMIDEYMIGELKIPGIVLMENAAIGVIGRILKNYPDERPGVLVICGLGNNGGDGFAVARGLLARGFDASAVLIGDPGDLKGDALVNFEILGALGDVVTAVDTEEELAAAIEERADAAIVVDAIFGTGLTREIGGVYLEAVRAINRMDAFCVSVDIPSGVSGDTGAVMGEAVRADATVTFQYPKIGHFVYPGKEYAGDLTTVTIGTDEGCPVLDEIGIFTCDLKDCALKMEPRRADTNKGDYGRLMIIAGSVGMAGAAVLASRAAIRTGAGLTTLASVDYVVSVVQKMVPEATCKILAGEMDSFTRNAMYEADRFMKDKTALAIGPGITENAETQELVGHMVTAHEITKVFDADALNVISRNTEILHEKTGDVILTPHPKEFSRLTERPVAEILADPVGAAYAFIQEYDVTLVLKGTTTIVASRERGCALISAGSPGMAKGGSGDVLTGIIASLAAQGKSAFDAAVLGVMIAGTAGEMAAQEWGEYAMTAGDTIRMIGRAIDALTEAPQKKKAPLKKKRAPEEPAEQKMQETPYDAEGYETPESLDISEDEEGTGEPEEDLAEEPELSFLQDEIQSPSKPKKAETLKQPYMRRKIEPKE